MHTRYDHGSELYRQQVLIDLYQSLRAEPLGTKSMTPTATSSKITEILRRALQR